MSKFKYQGRSEETVKERASKSGGDFDDFVKGPMFKPKEGENNIRILPITWNPEDGPGAKGYVWGDNWAIEVFIHRDVGPDKQTYLCPAKMKGEDCPLCDFRNETDDEELGKKAKAKPQLLAWIIDRADEKAGPQIWRVPMTCEKEIQLRSTPKGGGLLQVDHPEQGYDVSFRRKGSGLNTEYLGVDIDRNDSPIHDKESKQDAWLEYVEDHPLPDQLVYFTAEYIEKAFRAQGSKRDRGGDKEEDKPTRSSRRGEAEERPSREESRGRRGEAEEPDRRGRSRDRDAEELPEPERARGRNREGPEEGRVRDERENNRRLAQEEDRPRPRERDPAPRTRSRDPEPEEDKPKASGRYRSKEPDPDDEIPSEGKGRAPAKKDADDEEEVKPGKVAKAREVLRKLKPRD